MTYIQKLKICYEWQLSRNRWHQLLRAFGGHWINIGRGLGSCLGVILFIPLVFLIQFCHPLWCFKAITDEGAEKLRKIMADAKANKLKRDQMPSNPIDTDED